MNEYFKSCLPFELFIFNRWGNLVFNQKTNDPPFVGKSQNGDSLEDGVYTYKLLYENSEKSGFIHLIR